MPDRDEVEAAAVLQSFAESVNNGSWLKAEFPEKDWHQHRRTDGKTQWCDGTPSDCDRLPRVEVTDA